MERTLIRVIYLNEFKLGHNAIEASRNINEAFGQGTVTNCSVQNWFAKFHSRDESLDEKGGRGFPTSIDNEDFRSTIETDSAANTRQIGKLFNVNHSAIVRHLDQKGYFNKLNWLVPFDLTK